MTNLVLFNGLKNTITKIYKKYKKLIIKKCENGIKFPQFLKKKLRRVGIRGHMGIEDKDGE